MGKISKNEDTKYSFITKIVVIFSLGFAFYAIVGYFFIRILALRTIQEDLQWMTDRVKSDLFYVNGKWVTTLYKADPLTPHPAGSGGFEDPLYIITRNGFVIERNQLIHGYADTSPLKDILAFSRTQTVEPITDEKWRVLSAPIKDNGQIRGGILVAQQINSEKELTLIDQNLSLNLAALLQAVKAEKESIDLSRLNLATLDGNISVQIIDMHDKVVVNKGRVPTYLDSNQTKELFQSEGTHILSDTIKKEDFITLNSIIYDVNNNPVAVIVHGKSLKTLYKMLDAYRFYNISAFVISLICIPWLFILMKKAFFIYFRKRTLDIRFDPQLGFLYIDHDTFHFDKDTHQFRMLVTLFSESDMQWDRKVLAKKLQVKNLRTLYDALLIINKKINVKLICYHDNNYFINEVYRSSIQKNTQ